jgi:hypothetical protein
MVTPFIRSPWRNDATGDQVAAALTADGRVAASEDVTDQQGKATPALG